MPETNLDLDLDPKKILDSLNEISESSKKLAGQIEDALGKKATKAVEDLENKAEEGSNKISKFFRNLGQRVKEDLKTAFDATGVLAGAKFAKDMGDGIKQVFEMERAFDRLNTRLGLSAKQLGEFKKNLGQKVASTGQKLEDVLPGVETFAAKGNVKNPLQLENIAKTLGQVKATTGEDTSSLADTVVEILKNQGKAVTDKSVKDTIDSLQSGRVQGAFKTAEEAGTAVKEISPYAKQFHMGEREMTALTATASRGGEKGQDILRQLLERASKPGQQTALNSILGQNVFQGGKINAEALGKIDMKKFGQYSQQIMEEATGLQGASGADLARFVDSFKNNMDKFHNVIAGSNETATQFDTATDNFASKMDKFKESLKESTREIGSELSGAANDMIKGNLKGAGEHVKEAGKDMWENKGTIAAGVGLTAVVGALAGGGLKSLLGMGKNAAGAQIAKATGAQLVYVVNAKDFGGMSASPADVASKVGMVGGIMAKTKNLAANAAILGGSSMGQIATMGAGSMAAAGIGVAAAGVIGYEIGEAIQNTEWGKKATDYIGDTLSKPFLKTDEESMNSGTDKQADANYKGFSQRHPEMQLTPEQYAKAVETGTLKAMIAAKGQTRTQYTNPSAVTGRGGH